jgi:hypothetical protein
MGLEHSFGLRDDPFTLSPYIEKFKKVFDTRADSA